MNEYTYDITDIQRIADAYCSECTYSCDECLVKDFVENFQRVAEKIND